MMTRREMVRVSSLAGVAAASGLVTLRADAAVLPPTGGGQPPAATGPFTLPALGYAFDALEPHIDAQTMEIHHDRHHQTYVTNLNNALASQADLAKKPIEDLVRGWETLPDAVRNAVRNSGGGHLNHTMFWPSLKKGGGGQPTGELLKGIEASFGGFQKFQDAMTAAALGTFGSGWAWLSADKTGKLVVESTPNQDNPITRGNTPLLGVDVWEHAYYLKYQNRRADYLKAWWNVINWDVVQSRLAKK
ncbi:MAG: superoxide dismutase [Vicinamibacterales bacterium]